MPRIFAIYSRKSKFTGKGDSIENQIELCKQYIDKNYFMDPYEILVYEDEGFSGGNTQRPQFKKMMQDAKEKKFDVLVCYRLDRISRNVADFADIINVLNNAGISFVSIRETFDTSTPIGRAMMFIASVFAQLERETIAERIKDNLYELAKTGRWLGGTTPTGYKSESFEKITIDGKTRKAFKLTLIPEEAEMIKIIYDKFIETGSLTATEIYLNQNGYKTKTGVDFTRFAIKNILENPVYMIADEDAYNYITEKQMDLYSDKSDFDGKHGMLAYNRTMQIKGKMCKMRNEDEWVISVAKHKGIITGARWVKVQKILEQNSSKSYKKPRSNTALLSGLLFCGKCGGFMRPKMTKRINAQNERVYDYVCTTREKTGGQRCNIKRVNGNLVDKAVCEEMAKVAEADSQYVHDIDKLYETSLSSKAECNKEMEMIKKSISENEKDIAAYVASLAKVSESSAQQYIVKQIEACHEKGEALKRRLEEFASMISDYDLTNFEIQRMKQTILDFCKLFDKMTVAEKRVHIRSFVRRIEWDGENLHIYFFLDNESDIVLPNENRLLASKEPLRENSK